MPTIPLSPTAIRSTLLGLAAGALVTWPGAAAVQVVDCVDGPFLDIGAAVAASGPGDTVLVEPCADPYPPFTIDGKADLHVIGNGGAGVVPVGLPDRKFRPPVLVADDPDQVSFTCVGITGSDRVTLTGLTFDRCGFHAVNIESSQDVKILANRFEESFETIRDSTASGSQITGNLFVGGAFAVFVDGSGALVSQNVILNNEGSGISLLSPSGSGNQVVANVIVRGRGEAIFSAGERARIERNACIENEGALGQIVLSNRSRDSTIVGNITGGRISDSGTDNLVVGNR